MTDMMVSAAIGTAGYVFPKPGPPLRKIKYAIINYKSLLINDVEPFKLTVETMSPTEYNTRRFETIPGLKMSLLLLIIPVMFVCCYIFLCCCCCRKKNKET
jgi:hypothetical protein